MGEVKGSEHVSATPRGSQSTQVQQRYQRQRFSDLAGSGPGVRFEDSKHVSAAASRESEHASAAVVREGGGSEVRGRVRVM